MTRFAVLTSALVPGLLVVAIRISGEHDLVAASLLIISLLLIVFLARAVRARGRTNAQPFSVESVKDESDQVPAYLLTYIFPFLFLTIEGPADLWACLVFAFFLLVLVYQTNLALVNPLLLTVGYHLFRVKAVGDIELVLLAKTRPLRGQTVHVVHISDRTYKLQSEAE